ncbi:hypothetical protein FJZ26_03250 [Candidatus Parvarchaeota archaeon]|nr:hypothetical protein [Candidatus Parvarchaeota archaeon]
MGIDILGVLGLVFIVLAWVPETIDNYKKRGRGLDIKFVLLALSGSLLLAYHAYVINDGVFLILNLLTSIGGMLNLAMFIYYRRVGKMKKRHGKK